jgi:hypothetical protein
MLVALKNSVSYETSNRKFVKKKATQNSTYVGVSERLGSRQLGIQNLIHFSQRFFRPWSKNNCRCELGTSYYSLDGIPFEVFYTSSNQTSQRSIQPWKSGHFVDANYSLITLFSEEIGIIAVDWSIRFKINSNFKKRLYFAIAFCEHRCSDLKNVHQKNDG